MFVFSLAGSRDSNEDNIDASDSDMEKNSADENAEMQELCAVITFLNVEDILGQNPNPTVIPNEISI